jgi:hypothetical protein
MARLADLSVKHYESDRVPNPYPGGDLPWHVYHRVRNAVVRTCRRYGPTGPMGERKLGNWFSRTFLGFGQDAIQMLDTWESGDDNPIYWVVDDQYNHERYLYMDLTKPTACTVGWLEDITDTLEKFPGWGIGINSLTDGYALIFARKLLLAGPGFRKCKTAAQMLEAMPGLIRTSDDLED